MIVKVFRFSGTLTKIYNISKAYRWYLFRYLFYLVTKRDKEQKLNVSDKYK